VIGYDEPAGMEDGMVAMVKGLSPAAARAAKAPRAKAVKKRIVTGASEGEDLLRRTDSVCLTVGQQRAAVGQDLTTRKRGPLDETDLRL